MVVKIYTTVKNVGDVPVWIKVRGGVRTPKGNYAWSDYSDTVQLNKGQSKSFVINVPTTPSVSGTWTAIVQVYDATISPPKLMKEVTKTFSVTKEVTVTIERIEIV